MGSLTSALFVSYVCGFLFLAHCCFLSFVIGNCLKQFRENIQYYVNQALPQVAG